MTTITAHGATYPSAAAANDRIAELNKINMELGASDGRVTEITCIMDALEAAEREEVRENTRRRHAAPAGHVMGPEMTAEVRESERRVAALRAGAMDDGQWRYLKVITPEGRMTRREYRTEAGFLKAYIREARKGSEILIAE